MQSGGSSQFGLIIRNFLFPLFALPRIRRNLVKELKNVQRTWSGEKYVKNSAHKFALF